MKRNGCIIAITSLLWVVFLLLGCSLVGTDPLPEEPPPVSSDKGTLVISLTFAAKTLVPPISMDIASYDIRGTGPDPLYDQFSDLGNTTGQLTLSHINPGLWTITVDAKNAGGTIIGHGQTDPPVLIEAGRVTDVQITVVPLAGAGTLSLSVQWSRKVYADVTLQANLISMSTGQDLVPAFAFTPQGNPDTATHTNSAIAAGYYLLLLRLYNGGVQFWGIAESVRIVTGQTTSQTWTIN